jgi:hypothetical protein
MLRSLTIEQDECKQKIESLKEFATRTRNSIAAMKLESKSIKSELRQLSWVKLED